MTAGLMRDRGQGADAREPPVGLRRQRRVGVARVELDAAAAGVAGDLRHRRARPAALPGHRRGRLSEALARRLSGCFLLLGVRDVEAGAAAGPVRLDAIARAAAGRELPGGRHAAAVVVEVVGMDRIEEARRSLAARLQPQRRAMPDGTAGRSAAVGRGVAPRGDLPEPAPRPGRRARAHVDHAAGLVAVLRRHVSGHDGERVDRRRSPAPGPTSDRGARRPARRRRRRGSRRRRRGCAAGRCPRWPSRAAWRRRPAAAAIRCGRASGRSIRRRARCASRSTPRDGRLRRTTASRNAGGRRSVTLDERPSAIVSGTGDVAAPPPSTARR